MKRCPECDSTFPETEKFCEFDGTPLVADYSRSDGDVSASSGDRRSAMVNSAGVVDEDDYQVSSNGPFRENWKLLTLVAVGGAALGIILFVLYLQITRVTPEQTSNRSSSEAGITQQQVPMMAPLPSPSNASPSPEPSPSPSVTPTPVPQPEPSRAVLSSRPVSTGQNEIRRGQVTIRLTNGTSVEADEAWETSEGIWYRRRGVVTLLKRDQVKAIEKPSPAPAASVTPAPSPSPP